MTFKQKCNFYWGILTFKGSLLSGALILKAIFCKNSAISRLFTSQNLAVFRTADQLIVNFKAPKRHVYQSEHNFWTIKRAILTKIATCGLADETEMKSNKKAGEKVAKPLYFTTTWRRHFATDLHQIWWVCKAYRRYHASQVWLQNIH